MGGTACVPAMTTTTVPGATGTTAKKFSLSNFLLLILTIVVYVLAVRECVHAWGEPIGLRAAAFGVALPFIAPHLPLLRKTPRWCAIALAWAVSLVLLPKTFTDSMMTGTCWAVVVTLPVVFGTFVVLAFIANKRTTKDTWESEAVEDRIVLGLSGYAGSGKDTAAEGLLEAGFTRVSFADKIREVALAINPLIPVVVRGIGGEPDQLTYVRLDNYVDAHGWTEAKKNLEVRGLLQRIGTDAGRKVLGENVWVDAVMNNLPSGHILFTDMRFPNEYDAIMSQPGGVAVRINRPGVTSVNAHVSETALDGHLFHANIENSGSPTRVQTLLLEFLKGHTGHLL